MVAIIGAVGEDAAAAEVGEEHGGEAHAGEDGDVDLGMSEEPEEMEPEERASRRRWRETRVPLTTSPRGMKKLVPSVAVAEEEHDGGEEHGEGEDG